MSPHVYDLFGEIIITHQDISAWLQAVPRIDPQSPRAAHYVRSYAVVDKIGAAKLSGRFDAIVAPRIIEVHSAVWWDRMCWA